MHARRLIHGNMCYYFALPNNQVNRLRISFKSCFCAIFLVLATAVSFIYIEAIETKIRDARKKIISKVG